MKGVGVLPPEMAIAYSASGPVLRGSGVPYDVRRAEPYGIYDRFDWDVVTHPDCDRVRPLHGAPGRDAPEPADAAAGGAAASRG